MAKATAKKAEAPKKAAAKKAEAPAKKAAAKKAAAPAKNAENPKKASAPKKAPVKVSNSPEEQKSLIKLLFVNGLKDVYWAEKHLTKALPKLAKAATAEQTRQLFENHLVMTQQQIVRLEQVFQLVETKPAAVKCEAMEGLAKEADSIVSETPKGTMTRDAALIMAAQKIEHYEIASYGTLATLAKILGLEEAKNLLGETLQEEKDTDNLLTQLAESTINLEAVKEESEEAAEELKEGQEEESDPV